MQSTAKISFYWPELPVGRAMSIKRRPGLPPIGFKWTGTISMSGKKLHENETKEQRRSEYEAETELREQRAGEGLEHLAHAEPETGQLAGDPFNRLTEGYNELSRRSPNDVQAHFHYGRQFLQVAMNEQAIIAFKRVLEMTPKWADAQYYYASALFAAGRLDEAATEYEKARMLDPNMMEARVEHELLKIKAAKAQKNGD